MITAIVDALTLGLSEHWAPHFSDLIINSLRLPSLEVYHLFQTHLYTNTSYTIHYNTNNILFGWKPLLFATEALDFSGCELRPDANEPGEVGLVDSLETMNEDFFRHQDWGIYKDN